MGHRAELTSSPAPPERSAPARQIDEYRLIRRLGVADDAFVAHDTVLDRAVVLSFIDDEDKLSSLRLLAQVAHPNLCPIHRARDGVARRYVVSAFARGQPLDRVGAPLPDEGALRIGRGLAGALAALHAAGCVHGDVRAARVALSEEGEALLFGLERARARGEDAARRGDVVALLALLQSLAREGLRAQLGALASDAGNVPSADRLCLLLRGLAPTPRSTEGEPSNPYRGLHAYGVGDAALFFGRRRETTELVARLSLAPVVVVAGRSGVGKSSLVRAGLASAVLGGALGERPAWDVVTLVPGARARARPLESLADALAPLVSRNSAELLAALRREPELGARLLLGRDRGLLLIVDQLEELLLLSDAESRGELARVLGCLRTLAPGVRVVMTLRSDFLPRLGELGPLGQDILGATFFLPPMSREGLREAISEPALVRGFTFEAPAMIDELADDASADAGALPLLSFALAQLWTERDIARSVLPEEALRRMGGAAGALARHGDLLFATLQVSEREEARRILVRLAAEARTGARPTADQLLRADGGGRQALEALVRGRLVVAGETYEIAHESLLRLWPKLRAWLEGASEARAVAARLASSAREWERLGRSAKALWGPLRLKQLQVEGALDGIGRAEGAFVAASRAAARRARLRRASAWLAAPLAAIVLGAGIGGTVQWKERRETRTVVAARLREADAPARDARALDAQADAARAQAFALFDADAWAAGEKRWSAALAFARQASTRYSDASATLAMALARDPVDPVVRARAADLAYDWLRLATHERQPELVRDLRARLAQLDDDGSRRARLDEPARLWVSAIHPGASVALSRVRVTEGGRRAQDPPRAIDLDRSLELEPGSYLLAADAPGCFPTRSPVLLRGGGEEHLTVPLPPASAVPAGFVYVPGGETILGSADADGLRRAFFAQPEHTAYVGAFLIGEYEVTIRAYLEFLDALPDAERKARRPDDVAFGRGGEPTFSASHGSARLRKGELVCRPGRVTRSCQDWLELPVAGISWDDAVAYTHWLAGGRAPRVPGARLCSEPEWERAARGADDRVFPGGDELRATDANFDQTYGMDAAQMGADAVGSFPADVSVFGVFDLAGNVSEWVASGKASAASGARHVARGGFYFASTRYAEAAHRFANAPETGPAIGLRVCAPAPDGS